MYPLLNISWDIHNYCKIKKKNFLYFWKQKINFFRGSVPGSNEFLAYMNKSPPLQDFVVLVYYHVAYFFTTIKYKMAASWTMV